MTSHNEINVLNKPSRKWLWIISIILSLVGGILLIGIPGALLIGFIMDAPQISENSRWSSLVLDHLNQFNRHSTYHLCLVRYAGFLKI